ncbi:required for meiotic nuclear division protein 1 homolog isoform X6 [Nomia melanderi]|uniref:required for meiotic nuclear division protein 1 homolog isoform X6 n=2 Tax=Nomia melanderi TaxID=2448451 RepID=UPI0013046EAA|nr:required for meiotic nuclear division protein 1 homolog isoform X1 [Nomia melanderi]
MNFSAIQRCILLHWKSNINNCRKFSTALIPCNKFMIKPIRVTKLNLNCNLLHVSNKLLSECKINESNTKVIKNTTDIAYSSLQLKKRPKKRPFSKDGETIGKWNVKALASAEEYNLEDLMRGLSEENLYIPDTITTSITSFPDVIHATARYEIEFEPREVFFFREGTVVMWNISELEYGNIVNFLKKYEDNPYAESTVQLERETMTYTYADSGKRSHISNGNIMISLSATNLDKYTFSNAMAQSVKLGIWEASLDNYIDSIEFVTKDLKLGKKLRISQQEVLKKQGELFALRHSINLSSDLLDTPDFYWEREDLETLYQQTCSYFNITKRTKVINEKINHCVELVGLLSSHLSDRHHIRLEWMIIILIMVEVAFETLHYIDRYFS